MIGLPSSLNMPNPTGGTAFTSPITGGDVVSGYGTRTDVLPWLLAAAIGLAAIALLGRRRGRRRRR